VYPRVEGTFEYLANRDLTSQAAPPDKTMPGIATQIKYPKLGINPIKNIEFKSAIKSLPIKFMGPCVLQSASLPSNFEVGFANLCEFTYWRQVKIRRSTVLQSKTG